MDEGPHGLKRRRKVLYEEPPPGVGDNYTDPDRFLDGLIQNAHVRDPQVRATMVDALAVAVEGSLVLAYLALHELVLRGAADPRGLLAGAAAAVAGAALAARLMARARAWPVRELLRVALLAALLFVLAPVLLRLSRSVADDTLRALVALLWAAHLAAQDYRFLNGGPGRYDAPLAANSATLAAVLLASRLHSETEAFCLVLLFAVAFVLGAPARRALRPSRAYVPVASAVVLAAAVAVREAFGDTPALLHLLASSFVVVFIPVWRVLVERYKNEINGPWDEAVLQQLAR
jgi:phosphatidylinositol glycan class C protein